eukprot:CAMPEP_0176493856 /NCGR_PEP_ID=MMETSP0200_2-20121128/9769_1 /TAXON_ID=947934 /ORGANISM="Chaetoceros sp., Strain GSL56" /LENGTH=40 /DNA_ID= /DNA_START= /DNA_END= /DNA_ORIENTATION=
MVIKIIRGGRKWEKGKDAQKRKRYMQCQSEEVKKKKKKKE